MPTIPHPMAQLIDSLHRSWDLVMGNYEFHDVKPAAHGFIEIVVLNIYFYSYMAFMLLVLMNLLIAILMDG